MSLYRKISPSAAAIGMVAVLVSGGFLAVEWQHTNSRVTSNQRKVDESWCRFLEKVDYPRTTAAGRRYAAALKELEQERHCHGS